MKIGPYELDRVYQGDCLELMKCLPDKSIDLVLTDPPYGLNNMNWDRQSSRLGYGLATPKNYGDTDWDKKPPSKECFNEILRISKNQIIFGGNYFNLPPSSCWIVWDKDNGSNDFADAELAWSSFKSAVRLFKWRWNGMLQEKMNWKEERVHPTQKPLSLMRWCLEKYSGACESILDPFMGSGTTCLAAKQLGRHYLGFELEQKYVDIANKRLKQEVLSQWTLTN
jgi:DNA modification methylase